MFNILLFTSIHITYTLHHGFDDFSELLQKFLQREEGRRMLRSWRRTRSRGQRGGCGRHGRNGRPSRGPIAVPIERSFLHETKFGDCNVPCNVNLLMIVPVFVCVCSENHHLSFPSFCSSSSSHRKGLLPDFPGLSGSVESSWRMCTWACTLRNGLWINSVEFRFLLPALNQSNPWCSLQVCFFSSPSRVLCFK